MQKDRIKILSIGQFLADGESNTCLHRNWSLHKLGYVVDVDSTLPVKYALIHKIINKLFVTFDLPIRFFYKSLQDNIIKAAKTIKFDIIWIDKGIYIKEATVKKLKELQPKALIVGYSPDNMTERHNQTQCFLDTFKYYDYFFTTKSYTVKDLEKLGCNNVFFVNNAYEATFHHPYEISEYEKERLGGKVGFIGKWEKERCDSIIFLAEHGIPVRVWGGGKWLDYKGKYKNLIIEEKGLFSSNYNRALSAFDISLCFLRKINNDQKTTRTMEIPACGSLLMAERTKEHESLFRDGVEAVFFSSNEELLEKCKYYLDNPEKLKTIAQAGLKRCKVSGYSNLETLKHCIEIVTSNKI